MSESLQVTIVYERGEDGWIVASIPEVPGRIARDARARRRGRTSSTPCTDLELRFEGHPDVSEGIDSEPLKLVIGE